MKKYLIIFLRYLACFCIFVTVYPVVAFANGYMATANSLLESGVLICFGMAVFCLRDFCINRTFHPAITFFAPIFLIAAGTVCMFFYTLSFSIAAALLFSAIALLTGICAFLLAGKETFDLLTPMIITTVTVIDLVATFALLNRFSWEAWIIPIAYFLLCTVQFIITSQENLLNLTVSRHYSISELPQKIRSYNLTLIAKLLAIIAFSFLLLRNIKTILIWLYDKFSALFIYLLKLLLSIFGKETAEQPPPPPPASGLEKPIWANADQSSPSILGEILLFICQVLVFCAFIAFVGYLIYRLSKWRAPLKTREVTSEYTDSEQTLIALKRSKRSACDNNRRWRRDYSAFNKMADGEPKFRAGYSLAIRGLLLHGLPLFNSDTTCEIDNKAKPSFHEQAYHEATISYNSITYGENGYSAKAMQNLSQALSEIAVLKKK